MGAARIDSTEALDSFPAKWPQPARSDARNFRAGSATRLVGILRRATTCTVDRKPRGRRGNASTPSNADRRALEAGAEHHRPPGALSLPEAFLIDCRSGARRRKRLGDHEQRLQELPSYMVRSDL